MNQWHNQLAPAVSLDGDWNFSFYEGSGTIQVPATWEAQGYSHHHDGPAIYRKSVHIPAEWRGHRIQLQFDAVSYHGEVQVNDQPVGEHIGLWTPFAFDVTDVIRFDQPNEIALTVFKPGERFPMRESLAGFLPDVCIPFGGLWQSARLVAFPAAAISDVWVLSDADKREVRVKAEAHHAQNMTALIRIISPAGQEVASRRAAIASETIDTTLSFPSVQFWYPDHPSLYTAEIALEAEGKVHARVQRSFGFRALSKQDDQLLFNGAPVFLRGLLNWGWYPEILCPAPDEAVIRDEFRRVRAMGYNMVKLCLVVPSPLYFEIADREGMFLWLELPMWLPEVSPRLREQAPIEYRDILALVHAHPSIVLYSLGCELGDAVDSDLLSQLNTIVRSQTSGILACDNSGSGEAYGGLAFDYADFNDYHFYCDLHYFNPLIDHFRRDWRPARPWIFGEFCDADDFRDLDEIRAVQGGDLPWWFTQQNPIHPITKLAYTEQDTRMAALDLELDHQDLQRLSRQQSFVIRKAILEKVRGRAGMGGYVVTGLRDTPLATSSMFDDLSRFKYDADAFREFNADAVLLLEQGRARVWKNGGDRPAPLDRFNHISGEAIDFRIILSHTNLEPGSAHLRWSLVAPDGQLVQQHDQPVTCPPPGTVPHEIAFIALTAPVVDVPQQYTLHVELDGTLRNHWPLWIYPAVAHWPDGLALYDPSGALTALDDLFDHAENAAQQSDFGSLLDKVLITSAFTPQVRAFVQAGGRALVLQTGLGCLPVQPCSFWREAIKLLGDHPILNAFPHQGYVDLQFYNLATDYAFDEAALRHDLDEGSVVTPLIRRLDARQFTLSDYLVELNMGSGRVLASTLRFSSGAGDQVAGLKSNVAGRWLLYQMLSHIASEGFR